MTSFGTFWRLIRCSTLLPLALGSMVLAGCSSAPPYPEAPTVAASPDYLYKIGPGDSVNVTVWRNPELVHGRHGAARRKDNGSA